MIIWHLLADADVVFNDLGADHYDRHVNTTAKRRSHIRQLEALGYKVTLQPAARAPLTSPNPAWPGPFSD